MESTVIWNVTTLMCRHYHVHVDIKLMGKVAQGAAVCDYLSIIEACFSRMVNIVTIDHIRCYQARM